MLGSVGIAKKDVRGRNIMCEVGGMQEMNQRKIAVAQHFSMVMLLRLLSCLVFVMILGKHRHYLASA